MKQLRKAGPRDGWYEISPAEAQVMLDERAPNRSLNEARAERYRAQIARGLWAPNGESLIFDERDRLLDGQHRARAIVLANKPVEMYCIFGISSRYFPTIDDGAKRTAADAAGVAGIKNAAVVAGAARWIIRHAKGSSAASTGNQAISNKDSMDVIRKNQDLEEAVAEVCAIKGLGTVVPLSIIAYVYLNAKRDRPVKAMEFVQRLASGENLAAGDPILTLRKRFLDLRGERHKAHNFEMLAWCIKAWNAHRGGEKLALVKWIPRTGGRNAEPFPSFAA